LGFVVVVGFVVVLGFDSAGTVAIRFATTAAAVTMGTPVVEGSTNTDVVASDATATVSAGAAAI
jgi:sorbitol-specific phosphotransferase system component IIA